MPQILPGKLTVLRLNRYKYRNIALNGFFTEKTWDGSVNIPDKNIKMDLLGCLISAISFLNLILHLTLPEANLYKLNFDKTDTTSSVSMLLTSNFKGNNIDNIDGEIKLLNSNFVKYGNNLNCMIFQSEHLRKITVPVLSLRTDFVDADIKGYYNFAALGILLNQLFQP